MTGRERSRTGAATIARWRVTLGFLTAAIVIAIARPSPRSLLIGGLIAAVGELVRIWAAGHLHKGQEITQSGPYRFTRHPLYAGSAIMAFGVAVAAHNWIAIPIVIVYLAVTLTAAIQTEEASLDEKFEGAYSDYRAGLAGPVSRSFSWDRVKTNREHRAVVGLIAGFAILYLRSLL
jgi:protein-S-isoprenylcysteine O-methyltransferase Ste14